MVFSGNLRKTFWISVLGHLALFSIFSFSFGERIPKLGFGRVSFWGAILSRSDLISSQTFKRPDIRSLIFTKTHTAVLEKTKKEYPLIPHYYYKPPTNFTLNEDKIIFIPKVESASFVSKRKESTIIFHPLLPYHFLLYFKNRQTVHIELMFNIVSTDTTKSIIIKRKISSGNLEADLLATRYIGQYLFIQQKGFPTNNWQTVKIDLSAKND